MANQRSNRIAPLLACLAMASAPILAQDTATATDSSAVASATTSTDAHAADQGRQRNPASRSLFGKAIAELVGSMDDAQHADANLRDDGEQADAASQASRQAGEPAVPPARVVAQSDPR